MRHRQLGSPLQLADPGFSQPGRINLRLEVETFAKVMLHSRWLGIPDSPVAFETELGWVLAGNSSSFSLTQEVSTNHVSVLPSNVY